MSLSVYQYGNMGKIFRAQVKSVALATLRTLDFVFEKGIVPYPTKENTERVNSHTLIDLRDRFLECERPRGGRYKEFSALFNIAIIIYDFDLYYTERIDWIIRWLNGKKWLTAHDEGKPRERWWEETE